MLLLVLQVIYSNIVGPYEVEMVGHGKQKCTLTGNVEYSKKKGKKIEYKFLKMEQIKPQFHLIEELRSQHTMALKVQNNWRVKKRLIPAAPTSIQKPGLMAVVDEKKEAVEVIARTGAKRNWMKLYKKVGLVPRVNVLKRVVREKQESLDSDLMAFETNEMHTIAMEEEKNEKLMLPDTIEDPALARRVREKRQDLQYALEIADGDELTGVVTRMQLKETLAAFNIALKPVQFEELVEILDENGADQITYDAFFTFFEEGTDHAVRRTRAQALVYLVAFASCSCLSSMSLRAQPVHLSV